MKPTWIFLCSICFSMAPLWLPSKAGADPTTSKCAKIGDDNWGGKKELPKNQASIDMLMKLSVDCPAIAGSMSRLANDIKAHLLRQAEASKHLQQLPAYDPGAFNPVARSLSSF